ncbi:alpha-amylase family glycosyl hydrolase [Streptomyces sp. NPDC054784]
MTNRTAAGTPALSWLADAVFYQIYPQSFADSDGDGVGDFAGIAAHLDHLAWLGVNAVWLNPCFASPFRDAGYDVSDYFTTAPRYGTDDDLAALVEAARAHGIRVLLDLVPGHTSDRHPWFRAAADDPSDGRYVWAPRDAAVPAAYVPSPGRRPGFYLPNFFDSQPALNFGFARTDPAQPWRQPVDADGPRANRQALRDVMDHWLATGVSGFRVDMASSLVKDDPGHVETGRLWRELRGWLDREHPQAALLAEWGDPAVSVPAGFHADFFLQFGGGTDGLPMRSLWGTGEGTEHARWGEARCFFDAEARGTTRAFTDAWRAASDRIGDTGHTALPTANHDYSRLACGPRTREQLPAAFAFQLTWPSLPAIYYGDEIGMRYVPDLPDHEGSALEPGYNRAGCRTPMQWDASPGAGFSTAPPDAYYLPLDPDPGRPDVASQRADEKSLLHAVRRLVALRRATPALGPAGGVEVLHEGYPFVYRRGGTHLVVVNPGRRAATAPVPGGVPDSARPLEAAGVTLTAEGVAAEGFGYGVFAL